MFQFLFIDHWIHYHLQLYEGSSWVCVVSNLHCFNLSRLNFSVSLFQADSVPINVDHFQFFLGPTPSAIALGFNHLSSSSLSWVILIIEHLKSGTGQTQIVARQSFFCIDKQGILWTVGRRGKCGGSRNLTCWECETQAKYMRSEVSRVLILWFLWGFLLSTFLFILISSLLLCIGFSQKVCQLASRGFSEIWIST